jgi:hypothetical protein
VQDPVGEWLSMGGSSSEPWTVEVAGLAIYHPLVPLEGGVSVPQPDVERLDLSPSSQ